MTPEATGENFRNGMKKKARTNNSSVMSLRVIFVPQFTITATYMESP